MESKHNNWHQYEKASRTVGDIFSDAISTFVGSWIFILIHTIWFTAWVIVPVEAFPFGLLTLIVSLESVLLSTFIMMSQNRQSDRDRAQANADYETNLRAKEEIEELQTRLARIEDEKLDQVLKMLQEINDKK